MVESLRPTAKPREVDVMITSTVAGREVRIAIEAQARARPATIDWVECMAGNHAMLKTDQLILYAEAGFSRQALLEAESRGIDAISAEDVEADGDAAVLQGIRSLWPEALWLTPTNGAGVMRRRSGELETHTLSGDLTVFLPDATALEMLRDVVVKKLQAQTQDVIEQIGLASITESTQRGSDWEPFTVGIDDEELALHLRLRHPDDEYELCQLMKVEVRGTARIEVLEVNLKRARLGEVPVAYAEASLFGQPALLVASDGSGEEQITVWFKVDGRESTETIAGRRESEPS